MKILHALSVRLTKVEFGMKAIKFCLAPALVAVLMMIPTLGLGYASNTVVPAAGQNGPPAVTAKVVAASGARAGTGADNAGVSAKAVELTLAKTDGVAGNYSRFISVVKNPLGLLSLLGLLVVSFGIGLVILRTIQRLVMWARRRVQVREWRAARAAIPKVVDLSVFRSEKRTAA